MDAGPLNGTAPEGRNSQSVASQYRLWNESWALEPEEAKEIS